MDSLSTIVALLQALCIYSSGVIEEGDLRKCLVSMIAFPLSYLVQAFFIYVIAIKSRVAAISRSTLPSTSNFAILFSGIAVLPSILVLIIPSNRHCFDTKCPKLWVSFSK